MPRTVRALAAAAATLLVAAAAATVPRAAAHPNCLADVIAADGLELKHLERRADWSYEGKTGPENWGQFSATCATGSLQSPINFEGDDLTITDANSNPNVKAWKAVASDPVQFINNGHTVQVQLASLKQSTVQAGNRTYTLQQVHFHTPSEHHVKEKHSPLEAHFVHSDGSNLNVIGIFFEIGDASPFLAQLVGNIPAKANDSTSIANLDLSSIIAHISKSSFWTYTGSLTTPPCTEGVLWVVAKQPLTLSQAQYDALHKVMPFNARTTQENESAEGHDGSSGEHSSGGESKGEYSGGSSSVSKSSAAAGAKTTTSTNSSSQLYFSAGDRFAAGAVPVVLGGVAAAVAAWL